MTPPRIRYRKCQHGRCRSCATDQLHAKPLLSCLFLRVICECRLWMITLKKSLWPGSRYSPREEALAALPLKPDGFTAALTRQISKKRLANPRHGFYIILRSKDRIAGALDRSVGSISVLIAGYPSYAPPRCTARRTRPPLDRRVSGSILFKSSDAYTCRSTNNVDRHCDFRPLMVVA